MNTQPEAIMGSGENILKVGSNPCRTANNTDVFDGLGEPRTDSAQKTPDGINHSMTTTGKIATGQSGGCEKT